MQDYLLNDHCFGRCGLLRVLALCIVCLVLLLCNGVHPVLGLLAWLVAIAMMICLCVVCCVAMLGLACAHPRPLAALPLVPCAWVLRCVGAVVWVMVLLSLTIYLLGFGPGFLCPGVLARRLSFGVAVLGWFLLGCLPLPSAMPSPS